MNNQNLTNDNVQDGEIVEEVKTENPPTVQTTAPTAFDINAYNATLEIVRRRITLLEKAKIELSKLKEMHDDIFVNDANYNEADKAVKEVTKKRKDIEAQLSRQPQAVEISGKLKDLKNQIKENQDALSQELMDYYKTSGVTEIEDEEGNVQEFTIVIRLKSKKRVK